MSYARLENGQPVEIIPTLFYEADVLAPLDPEAPAEAEREVLHRKGEEIAIADRFHPAVAANIVPWEEGKPLPEAELPEAPPPPRIVSRRQGRRALLAAGLLNQVQVVIDALPEPQRSEAQVDWDDATEFDRDSELFQQLAPALGLDEEALDGLFASAATF